MTKSITIKLTPEQRLQLEPMRRAITERKGDPIDQVRFIIRRGKPAYEVDFGLLPLHEMNVLRAVVADRWVEFDGEEK